MWKISLTSEDKHLRYIIYRDMQMFISYVDLAGHKYGSEVFSMMKTAFFTQKVVDDVKDEDEQQ
jgi:hypothetical protein